MENKKEAEERRISLICDHIVELPIIIIALPNPAPIKLGTNQTPFSSRPKHGHEFGELF
jgi:hypothetical protein